MKSTGRIRCAYQKKWFWTRKIRVLVKGHREPGKSRLALELEKVAVNPENVAVIKMPFKYFRRNFSKQTFDSQLT